jgi:hypothetical protein
VRAVPALPLLTRLWEVPSRVAVWDVVLPLSVDYGVQTSSMKGAFQVVCLL